MRMKFNKPGQLLLVALAGLSVAALLSACGTLTVDFVYVTSAKAAGSNSYGEIDVYEVNSESGHMRQIPTSPFPSGGRNPVAEAVSADHLNLYVVNHDDNSVVRFIIGPDGKVYPQQTVNTPGVFPMGAAVSGGFLFVADTYQPLPVCSSASPCSGSIAAFPINTVSGATASNQSNGNLVTGMPINACNGLQYAPLALSGSSASDLIQPTAIQAFAKGGNLFVAAYDSTAGAGYLFGYTIGSTSCSNQSIATLTPISGSPWALGSGVKPSAVTQDPTGSYVYVADYNGARIFGFSVGSTGTAPLSGSPFSAGNQPAALVFDATGKYLYVANSLDSNVTGYSMSGGVLTALGSFATDTQPVAIGIDPSKNQFLYTANFLANTVSGFQVNASTGTLLNAQKSPFSSNANPTAVAAVPHK